MELMKMTIKTKSDLKFIAEFEFVEFAIEFEFVEFAVEFEFVEFNLIDFVRKSNTILNNVVRIINCHEISVLTSRIIAIFFSTRWTTTILKK